MFLRINFHVDDLWLYSYNLSLIIWKLYQSILSQRLYRGAVLSLRNAVGIINLCSSYLTWLITEWHSVVFDTSDQTVMLRFVTIPSLLLSSKVKLCLHGACLPSRTRGCRPARCWGGPGWLSSAGTGRLSWRTSARWVPARVRGRVGCWEPGGSCCVCTSQTWVLLSALGTVPDVPRA